MPSGLHTWSQTAGTNATADSAINQAEGMAPSAVNDSARATMAVLAKWRDDNNGSLTTAGSSTAYTLTTNTVFTTLALMDNATIAFIPHTTSGATPTLNVDGLGAKVIRSATGVALPTGALLSGSVYRATYDNGNTEWLLQNVFPVLGPTTISGTLGVSGDFAINTNKFTVAATSGNTLVAGTFDATGAGAFASTLSATGNFAVNTNKFTVTAASGNTLVAGTLDVTGNASFAGSALSSSTSAGVGYKTGAGGTVTQLTNKVTGVTLNKICGQIVTMNTAMAAGDRLNFTLTNSTIAATDVVAVSFTSPSTASYTVTVDTVAAGSCRFMIINQTASLLSDVITINFAVIKAVTS